MAAMGMNLFRVPLVSSVPTHGQNISSNSASHLRTSLRQTYFLCLSKEHILDKSWIELDGMVVDSILSILRCVCMLNSCMNCIYHMFVVGKTIDEVF